MGWMDQIPGAWHGDTYKSLFLINHFLRSYDYATIVGPDNPQTILWRKALYREDHRLPFVRFENQALLQAITERLDSLDYHKTMDCYEAVFHNTRENELFQYLEKARKE